MLAVEALQPPGPLSPPPPTHHRGRGFIRIHWSDPAVPSPISYHLVLWWLWFNSTCIRTLLELPVWLYTKALLYSGNSPAGRQWTCCWLQSLWGNKASEEWLAQDQDPTKRQSQKENPDCSESKSSLFYHAVLTCQRTGHFNSRGRWASFFVCICLFKFLWSP